MNIEPTAPTSPSPIPKEEHLPARKLNKRFIAIIFLVGAVVFTIIGLREMYTYESEDKVVGGDAYNFIILASRGTGLICFCEAAGRCQDTTAPCHEVLFHPSVRAQLWPSSIAEGGASLVIRGAAAQSLGRAL